MCIRDSGWSYFITDQFVSAADYFRLVLDESGAIANRQLSAKLLQKPKTNRIGSSPTKIGLSGDSLLMMARCFGEGKGIDALDEYFSRIGDRDYRGDVYKALGDNLVLQDRLEDAVLAYHKYLKIFPESPKALDAVSYTHLTLPTIYSV